MSKLLLILVFTFVYGCSTASFKDLFGQGDNSEKRNEELMKDFEVKDEVLEKFQIKSPKKITSKQEDSSKKLKTLQPTPKKKSSHKRTVDLPTKKKVTKSNEASEKSQVKYPEDYPDKLKKYDLESKRFWQDYKPYLFPGEVATLEVTYMGISTGNISVSTLEDTVMGDEKVYHIQTRLKTSSYYSYLYEVDDLGDSYIEKESFLPLKFSLIQRQSSQSIDDLQLFDRQNLKSYSFYKRVTSSKTKKSKKEEYIPRLYQDPFSSLYFLRGLPMDIGAEYHMPIVNQGKVEILSAKIDSKELLDTKLGKMDSYKVKVHTNHKGKTIKGGYMNFWFSADDRRIFLKFDAKIKIGKVKGELTSYKK